MYICLVMRASWKKLHADHNENHSNFGTVSDFGTMCNDVAKAMRADDDLIECLERSCYLESVLIRSL